MSIGEILLGLLVGGGVGGGASYFLQKSRVSEVAERYDQKYSQTRQALEAAETELDEKKMQLLALSQSEAQAKTELQKEQANYQNHLEQIERSYQIQLEENRNQASIDSSELERAKAQLLDYQNQLQEIKSAYQAEFQQQQTYSTQFQEIEQAYQNQIIELENTHQTQILELEQAYQSQILELQQVKFDLAPRNIPSERPEEIVQSSEFTEPWDEDFSKTTLLEMPFTKAEEISEIASLEELADLTSQISDKFKEPTINESEQAEFFASQTLIDEMSFLESLEFEAQDSNSRFELEDLTSAEDDFVLTSEEMKTDSEEQFTLDSNNPFELTDESIDLELFDLFETPKDEDLVDEEKSNGMHTNGLTNREIDVYSSETDLEFFNMLEKEHPESESLDLDDEELNIEDLFSEDLFHSEWESSPKN